MLRPTRSSYRGLVRSGPAAGVSASVLVCASPEGRSGMRRSDARSSGPPGVPSLRRVANPCLRVGVRRKRKLGMGCRRHRDGSSHGPRIRGCPPRGTAPAFRVAPWLGECHRENFERPVARIATRNCRREFPQRVLSGSYSMSIRPRRMANLVMSELFRRLSFSRIRLR